MLQIRAEAGGTELTGTLYEPGEDPPTFEGAPDEGAPYTWICDEFYEVETGGARQRIDDRDIRIAFESPVPRGFESRDRAIDAARDHLRVQFARIGVEDVEVRVLEASTAGDR